MLSWDEEVTPTASLPPSSSRSDPLMAGLFSGPSATLATAPVSATEPIASGPLPAAQMAALGTTRRLNAADKRIINGKTDVNLFAWLIEGLFYYVGFTQIPALGRQNKMTGAAEQYQYSVIEYQSGGALSWE